MQGRTRDREREVVAVKKEFEDFKNECRCQSGGRGQNGVKGSSFVVKKGFESLGTGGENISEIASNTHMVPYLLKCKVSIEILSHLC